MKQATERGAWRGGAGAPSADDVGRYRAFETALKGEMEAVEEEAAWLGDRSRTVWKAAFELAAKRAVARAEQQKKAAAAHDAFVEQYARGDNKPWPRELPGGAARAAYAELKAKAMGALGERERQAMLEGRPALQVVGEAPAGELRKSLMDRAVKVVPLLQRLQAEARAVRVARERDQVDDATLGAFDAVDGAMKREIDEVKGEAEWLSDQTGQRRGMGEQIWPMAFQVYAQRRAEVARRAESAKAS